MDIIVTILAGGIAGIIIGAATNKAQGDDVVKSAKGGLAGGLATGAVAYVAYKFGIPMTF